MIEVDLGVRHHFSSHVYAKEMHLPANHFARSHKHAYDHLSILAKGKAIVVCDGVASEYTSPACIEIKAGIEHAIHAVSDITWFCVHATDETDINRIDEVLTMKEGD